VGFEQRREYKNAAPENGYPAFGAVLYRLKNNRSSMCSNRDTTRFTRYFPHSNGGAAVDTATIGLHANNSPAFDQLTRTRQEQKQKRKPRSMKSKHGLHS
jgi:hypothetical protein